MKCLSFILLLIVIISGKVSAYDVRYAEQFYRLYHQNFYRYPEELLENIWYLENALKSDFANPLHALSRYITDKVEWERYRYLFAMHVNLELVRQYRLLAAGYDKRKAYFFNAPWRDQNLKSLEYAESYYRAALHYWEEALSWSEKAWNLRFIEIDDLQQWMDDNYRIETYDLDYYEIVMLDLDRLEQVRSDFLAMDEDTY